MKKLTLVFFIIGLMALFAQEIHACSCAMPEVAEAYDEARTVFIGEVTRIVKPRTYDPNAPLADRLYQVTFKVEKSWKGLATFLPEVTVLSNQNLDAACTWGDFVKGEKYLVYAEGTPEKDLAVLFSCNRTTSLADATEDLKMLEGKGRFTFDFTNPEGKQ